MATSKKTPGEILKSLYETHGDEAFEDGMRVYYMFADYYFHDEKILRVMRLAISDGVSAKLISLCKKDENEQNIQLGIIKQTFKDRNSLEAGVADYAVDCLAYAVGIIDKISDLDKINKQKQDQIQKEEAKLEQIKKENEKARREKELLEKEKKKLKNKPSTGGKKGSKKKVIFTILFLVILAFLGYKFILPQIQGEEISQQMTGSADTSNEEEITPPQTSEKELPRQREKSGNGETSRTSSEKSGEQNFAATSATNNTSDMTTAKEEQEVVNNESDAEIIDTSIKHTIVTSEGTYIGYLNTMGQKHGQGTFQYNSGNKYVGNWVNNKMSGFGTYYSSEGWRYEGDFQNSQFHGTGKYYNKKGKLIKEGTWVNGQMQ